MADKFGFAEQKVKLPDICTIQYGFAFDSKNFTENVDNIPLVRIRDVKRGYSETYYSGDYDEEYIVREGDLLIGMDGEFNIARWRSRDSLLNQRVCRIQAQKGTDEEYLRYVLVKKLKQIEERTAFVTVKHLSAKELNAMALEIPAYEAQKTLSSQLSKIEGLIELRQKQLDQLDTLIKARFVEMFGVPGLDAKYETIRLKECCIVNPKKNNDLRLQDGLEVSFVPMPAVSEHGDIDTSEIRLFEDVKTGFTYFAEGDVLFAKITPCMENGKVAVARNLKNGIGFGSTEFHVLRPDYEMANSVWLYTLTTFKQFRVDAESKMTGSAGQRRVSASFLKNYKVSLPPIELQNQFADFVTQVDKLKVVVQESLNEAQTLFDSLMQEYFG